MKINVKHVFSFEKPITVQTGWWNDGYFEMESCNHAGAYEDSNDVLSWNYQGDITSFTERFMVCDKCEESWDITQEEDEMEEC